MGRLVKVTQDALTIHVKHRGSYRIPLSSLSEVEVSIGRHRNTGKGMAIGLGAGMAIIEIADLTLERDDPDEDDISGLALTLIRHISAVFAGIWPEEQRRIDVASRRFLKSPAVAGEKTHLNDRNAPLLQRLTALSIAYF